MTQRFEKQSRTTRKALSQIYLIMECLMFGEQETARSLCKSMMQSLSNIPRNERGRLLSGLDDSWSTLFTWIEEEDLSSLME